MVKNQKYMQFANFNITFGQNQEPMLEHFVDILYPAFSSDYRRVSADKETCFYFSDVKVKEIDEDIVLVGNIIKDTQYNVYTTLEDGKLISNPSTVPTAPYSRFIIKLSNHRMVLVGNEPKSPDIRSFQALVKSLLDNYRRIPEKEELGIPYALVNIVDIPLNDDVKIILSQAKKIKSVRLRFFPLNNDINPVPMAEAVNNEMRSIGSNHANIQFTSPGNPDSVLKLLQQSAGLAATTVVIQDQQGKVTTIKDKQFASKKEIDIPQNVDSHDDSYILSQAKQDEPFTRQSEDNTAVFNKLKGVLKSLIS